MTVTRIPVLPLQQHGEYIECQTCHATFDETVLQLDDNASLGPVHPHFSEAIKRVMILMMLADGKIKQEERTAIQDIFHSITGRTLSDADVRKEVLLTRAQEPNMDVFLNRLLGCLNGDGKLLVLQAAYAVAQSDGEFAPRERTFLMSLGERLEMAPQHIEEVLNTQAYGD